MITALAQRWWVFLVRGLCAILIGIVAFTQPLLTLFALIVVWGAFALSDGVTALWTGWMDRHNSRGIWPFIVSGIVSLLAGITAWMWPGLTALVLLTIIAVWSIVRGVFEIVAAIRLRKFIHNEWLLATSGALSILFGVVLLSRPGAGLLALTYLIGGYALLSGVVMVFLAFRLRKARDRFEPHVATA